MIDRPRTGVVVVLCVGVGLLAWVALIAGVALVLGRRP